MMHQVKANRHRFKPITFGLSMSDVISAQVCFDFNCKYDLKGDDQQDINKLFGVGFFPHHHRNSARFGWRWSIVKQKIELFAYVYNRGVRQVEYLDDVRLGDTVTLTITKWSNRFGFIVEHPIRFQTMKFLNGNPSFIGYKLGPYFGGNRPAPHKMRLWISPK
jgi:hypothetical protein